MAAGSIDRFAISSGKSEPGSALTRKNGKTSYGRRLSIGEIIRMVSLICWVFGTGLHTRHIACARMCDEIGPCEKEKSKAHNAILDPFSLGTEGSLLIIV